MNLKAWQKALQNGIANPTAWKSAGLGDVPVEKAAAFAQERANNIAGWAVQEGGSEHSAGWSNDLTRAAWVEVANDRVLHAAIKKNLMSLRSSHPQDVIKSVCLQHWASGPLLLCAVALVDWEEIAAAFKRSLEG